MPVKYRKLPKLSAQDIQRFRSKVDYTPGQGPQGTCWVWTGGFMKSSGYGRFSKKRVYYGAHRIAYHLHIGVDPGPHLVCHECDYKPCVRGEHLFLGSHQVNADDMKAKGRSATGNRNGMRTRPDRTSPGEKNGYSKLSDGQVREICRAYDDREADQYELAARFHVWQMTISRIVRRVSRATAHTLTKT